MKMLWFVALLGLAGIAVACSSGESSPAVHPNTSIIATGSDAASIDVADTTPGTPGYAQLHETVLLPSCAVGACHTGSSPIAGLSFDDRDESYGLLVGVPPINAAAVKDGLLRVASGEPSKSFLIHKLSRSPEELASDVYGAAMPMGGEATPGPKTIAAFKAWITAGAPMDGVDFEADVATAPQDQYISCAATDEAGLQACFGKAPNPEKMLRLFTPPLEIAGAAEQLICAALSFVAEEDVLLTSALGQQMEGGHHIAVYVSDGISQEPPHECDEQDMTTLRFIVGAGGAGGASTVMPDGVALRISKGQQVVIQSHYINTDPSPRTVMDAVDLVLVPPGADPPLVADALAVLESDFSVPALAVEYESVKECTMDAELDVHLLLGHTHDFGVFLQVEHVPSDGPEEVLYTAYDGPLMRDDPEVMVFGDAPLHLSKGDRLRLTCRWTNTTTHELGWPEEMCVMLMFYTPGNGFLICDSNDETPVLLDGGEGEGCVDPSAAGNEWGVGEHCTAAGGECADNASATFCLATFDPSSNFCSIVGCEDDAQCGEDAICLIEDLGSACVPTECL